MPISASKLLASNRPLSPAEESELLKACSQQLSETLAAKMNKMSQVCLTAISHRIEEAVVSTFTTSIQTILKSNESYRILPPSLVTRQPRIIYVHVYDPPSLN